MDSVIVQGKAFDCTLEQLLPSIMNGIRPDLQEAILNKDPDIKDMVSLRKAAIFAQACRPAATEVVMATDSRQQRRARSPSPYRQHMQETNRKREDSRFGQSQRPFHGQSNTFWQYTQHMPRYTQGRQQQQGQVQRLVTFNTGKQCNFCGGSYHFDILQCPTRHKQCYNCLKYNHVVHVCMSQLRNQHYK